MHTVLFIALLSCPATKIIDKTTDVWTEHDKQTMQYCIKRCKEIYQDAPCLKEFYKLGFQSYAAICGK